MSKRSSWLALALMLAGCGSEEEEVETGPVAEAPEPVAEGAAEPVARGEAAAVATVEPEHGGTVVHAGRYPIEVVPHASGQIHAYVLGDDPVEGAEITVTVPVRGRATGRPVRLRWNARRGRYEGRVRRVEIVEGPIDVVVIVGGVEYHGHVDVCVVLPAIEVHVAEHHHHHKHKHKHKHRRHHHHHHHDHHHGHHGAHVIHIH